MLSFQIGTQFYADSTHPGWGSLQRDPGPYDQATGAVFAEVALSGLSKNVALIGTATAWGAIGRTYSNYFLSAVRMAVVEIVKTAALDDGTYSCLEPTVTWGSATSLSSWTAAEVALSGLSKNIALGGPGFGSFQPSRTLALTVSRIRYFSVAGAIGVTFALPPPQGFAVTGAIGVRFTRVAGAVRLSGSFSCAGQITATFTPPSTSSFSVQGDITASFNTRGGQQATCISAGDVPAASARPANAVY